MHAGKCCVNCWAANTYAYGCRHFAPALVLSLLDPQLSWDEAEVQASIQAGVQVTKADGSPAFALRSEASSGAWNILLKSRCLICVRPSSPRAML